MKLELISGSEWFYTSAEGWTISPYDNGVQTFELQNSGTSDLNFILAYSPNPSIIGGSFFIHYYENGDVINKTKVVSWN